MLTINEWVYQPIALCFGGSGSAPAAPVYTPAPPPPPQAAPATLASSSQAQNAASQQTLKGAAGASQDIGAAGVEGVAPSSVTTAKQTLGGVS